MDDVVPGNPAGIHELAQHWVQEGQATGSAATTLRSAKNDIQGGNLRLRGDFAPKVQDAIGDLPGELDKLARGYDLCGQALDRFATRLTEAQAKSRTARDDWDVAARNQRNAEYDLDGLAPGWEVWADDVQARNAYIGDHFPDTSAQVQAAIGRRDQAKHDVGLAETLARQAAALRGDAERDCVRDINHALDDSGLKNRTWWQKVGDYLKESFTTWDGFVKLCENISMVLGVVALFLSGPLALIVGAILLATTIVSMLDTLKKFKDGEIGWKDLALQAGFILLSRFGGKALKGAFSRLSRTKFATGLIERAGASAGKLGDRLKLGDRTRNLADRALCTVTGHPVDVATGKVFTDIVDLELPGPLPLIFQRVWYSTSSYLGPLGHGWHHSLDAALYVTSSAVLYRTTDGRTIDLLPLYPGTSYYDRRERLTVHRDDSGYRLVDAQGQSHRFAPRPDAVDRGWVDPAPAPVVHMLRDVVSRSGHRISLSYNENGHLSEIVDSAGRDLRFEHDEHGRIAVLTAPDPQLEGERFVVARYGYDELGNLASMTDALGEKIHYEYDGHLMVTETDRNGLSFHFEYDGPDERARCTRTWGDGGIYDHRLSYQAGLTTVLNSLGHSTRHEHEDGLVIRTVDALDAETRTEFEYQQPVQQTDALGRVTAYKYDYRGNVTQISTPDGATTTAEFDERDLPTSVVDPIGGLWTWVYDESGRLRERRDPLERARAFEYRGGLLSSMTDPAGGRTELGYDEAGSLISLRTPDGATSGWSYDALGRLAGVVDPLGGLERYRRDLLGRVVEVAEPDGNLRRLTYDGEGDLLSLVDRLSDVRFAYRGTGRIGSRTEAGTTVRFEYDTEEQLTGIVNEHGRVYGFTYGPTGELASERGFDDLLRLYERDRHGRVVSVRRASGLVSRYRYDDGDRVGAVTYSDGTASRYEYRLDGQLTLAENPSTTVRFERDPLGRVVRERQGDHWVSSEYDLIGNRVRVRSSLGADLAIERDALGAVTAVSQAGRSSSQGRFEGGSEGGFEARFSRDALGQELVRELPGGVRARWHRDRQGRPIRHEVLGPAGTVRERGYDWDVDARLRAVVDASSGPIRYAHDEFGQLVSATRADGRVELRMPDAIGNLFHSTDRADRVYGPAGQLLRSTDVSGRVVSYGYDAEGNLLSKRASDGEQWAYRWGAEGNLVEVTRPDGSVVGFEYDALGRRVGKTYRGQTTRWVWDGDVPLHEWVEGTLDEAGAPTGPSRRRPDGVGAQREAALAEYLRRGPPERGHRESPITWLFEPESFAPLAKLVGGHAESIVTDHLGTPVAMFDDAGRPAWSGDLSIWGELQLAQGDAWACPFRWPGQYEDAETGLYYNRFRYYDPESGQYASPDPIGLGGGLSVYAYVSDPLGWVDVLGFNGMPSLPGKVLFEKGRIKIIHNYENLVLEHADPIHFHVLKGNTDIGKVKADGTILSAKRGNAGDMASASRMIGDEPGLKTQLRRAEGKIAKYIRATGGEAGGRPFRPGGRGCGGV